MASGWAPDSAVQDQTDATISDPVSAVRSGLPSGEVEAECDFCGEGIPNAARKVGGLILYGSIACDALASI